MGACLSRNSGSDNDFRNLNDSRHVMLLLAKKERKRDRAIRRSISLGGHADADPDASMSAGYHPAEPSGASRHTSTTATTMSNNNSQRSVASLQRSDSHSKRSRRSLTTAKQPSVRRSLIDTQKELESTFHRPHRGRRQRQVKRNQSLQQLRVSKPRRHEARKSLLA